MSGTRRRLTEPSRRRETNTRPVPPPLIPNRPAPLPPAKPQPTDRRLMVAAAKDFHFDRSQKRKLKSPTNVQGKSGSTFRKAPDTHAVTAAGTSAQSAPELSAQRASKLPSQRPARNGAGMTRPSKALGAPRPPAAAISKADASLRDKTDKQQSSTRSASSAGPLLPKTSSDTVPQPATSRRDTRPTTNVTDTIPSTFQTITHRPTGHSSYEDFLAIVVIWSSGIMATLSAAILAKSLELNYTLGELDYIDECTKDLFFYGFPIPALIVLGTMAAVAYLSSILPNHCFWFLQFGLFIVCLIIPILGILSENDHQTLYPIAIYWLNNVWFLVHPLRFFFIFYQYFPMRGTTSHRLVSINLLLTGTMEYICVILLNGKPFAHSTVSLEGDAKKPSLQPWWLLLIFTGLLVLILNIYVVKFIKEIPTEGDEVRDMYKDTVHVYSFDRRQYRSYWIIVTCLVIPGCIFTKLETSLITGIDDLRRNAMVEGEEISRWQIELLTSLITIVLVEVFISIRKHITETTNLLIICIAFISSLATLLVLLFVVLPETEDARSYMVRPGNAIIHIITDPFIAGGKNVMWQIGQNQITTENDGLLMRKIPLDDDLSNPAGEPHHRDTKKVRLFEVNSGEVIIDEEIPLDDDMVNLFQQVNNPKSSAFNYTLVKVQIDSSAFQNMDEPNPRIYLLNALEYCTLDESNPFSFFFTEYTKNKTARPLLTEMGCAPLEYHLGIEKILRIPDQDQALGPLMTPCQYFQNDTYPCLSLRVEFGDPVFLPFFLSWDIGWTKAKVEKNCDLKVHVDLFPYTIVYLRLESMKINKPKCFNRLNAYRYSVHRTASTSLIICPSVLLGIAMGLSRAAYIHFMWINLPIHRRALIIYGYFALDFLTRWTTDQWIHDLNEYVTKSLLGWTGTALTLHLLFSLMFYVRLALLRFPEETGYWDRFF